VATNQMRREAAKRKLERQQQRRIQQAKRRQRVAIIASVAVVVVAPEQFDSMSTEVVASKSCPSVHVVWTLSVIVPVMPPGTIVVAEVVSLAGTGDV